MRIVKEWHTEAFKKEVKKLYDGFLQFCLLWGLVFGENDDSDNDNKAILKAIEFTKKEFPKRHPKLGFKRVFGTLFHVATSYDKKGCFYCSTRDKYNLHLSYGWK